MTVSPRKNILEMSLSLLTGLPPFWPFGVSVHISFTFSKTMLKCLSKARTLPSNFLLLRQLMRTCVLFLTDWVSTDSGPVENSSSSSRSCAVADGERAMRQTRAPQDTVPVRLPPHLFLFVRGHGSSALVPASWGARVETVTCRAGVWVRLQLRTSCEAKRKTTTTVTARVHPPWKYVHRQKVVRTKRPLRAAPCQRAPCALRRQSVNQNGRHGTCHTFSTRLGDLASPHCRFPERQTAPCSRPLCGRSCNFPCSWKPPVTRGSARIVHGARALG